VIFCDFQNIPCFFFWEYVNLPTDDHDITEILLKFVRKHWCVQLSYLKNKSYLIAISSVFSTYSIISTIILWSVSACVKTSWLSGICLKSLKLKKKQKHFRTKLCMLKVRQLNTSVFSHKFQQYFSYIMVVSWEVI
jgi:hypothetical protein